MAIQSMQLDPGATSYADLSELDPTAATKLAGIAEGADVGAIDPNNLSDDWKKQLMVY